MSYYNPGPPGAYQYGYPPAQYPGYTSGAYQYPTTAGYGSWPYYYPQQHQQQPQATQQRPTVARTSSSTPARTSTSFATTHTPASYAARDTVNAASGGGGARASAGGKKQANLRGLFTKELRNLMYGFGDDKNPANDTINVMEEILIEYIIDVCQTSMAPSRKTRLSIEEIRRALAKPADAKKLARMEELLFMQEDIKRARAQFPDSEMNAATFPG